MSDWLTDSQLYKHTTRPYNATRMIYKTFSFAVIFLFCPWFRSFHVQFFKFGRFFRPIYTIWIFVTIFFFVFSQPNHTRPLANVMLCSVNTKHKFRNIIQPKRGKKHHKNDMTVKWVALENLLAQTQHGFTDSRI